MLCIRVARRTRVLRRGQVYAPLHLRDEELAVSGEEGLINSMVSAWEPTPEELERLAKGAPVYLRVLGTVHPPVQIEVGREPDMKEG